MVDRLHVGFTISYQVPNFQRLILDCDTRLPRPLQATRRILHSKAKNVKQPALDPTRVEPGGKFHNKFYCCRPVMTKMCLGSISGDEQGKQPVQVH